MTRLRHLLGATALAALTTALLALPPALPAQALSNLWATWTPITGTANDYALRMQQASPGFPGASVASDSRAGAQLVSGASTFLGPGTPPGATYGTSRNSPYLNLRPLADRPTSPSTTTYTFDHPTPDTGWAFVLGDVDADQVEVRAVDATGARVSAAEVDSWFRGPFNYAGGADQPTWDAASSTLVGNPTRTDTDGASGWFEPDVRLSALTFVFTQRAGFPVYQTWFVSRARPLGGTVDDVSTVGACPVQSLVLTLVSPWGETLATTSPDATGAYSFGEWATQAGYTVRLTAPASCAVVGPSAAPLDNRGSDGSPASRGDFEVRQVIPQPISGTVTDTGGHPVPGVTVTLTRPGGGTVTQTTGPDGTYLFDDNAMGAGYSVAVTVPPGYAAGPGGTTITGLTVASVPLVDRDFVLQSLPSVSGQVTGGGDGLGGITVTLTPAGGGPSLTTVTAGDGTYSFPHVPPGTVTLTITAPPGYGGATTRTTPVGAVDVTQQDFALTRPGTVTGTVTDAGGPVGGVSVVVDGPGGPQSLTTDAGGGYLADGLAPGAYTVTVTPPAGSTVAGAGVLTTTITAAGEVRGGLDFVLAAPASPSATPSATTSASPSASPTAAPTTRTPHPQPSGTGTPGSGGPGGTGNTGDQDGGASALPDTGGPSWFLAPVAAGLLLAGAALLLRERHRRSTRPRQGEPGAASR
ncbi:hypothetical protein G5V58_11785 [Nocardioides anomalus]|uniref:Uncharacterized protein n=1 Tax=Nocardioides anomalus TaxID=2712223 RepID=A0A6G6WE26_9ACTN|nr:carboxypeptidase regulatory-like domain-containing protein [Nocardioides anomalus]QIG43355.1 hypothetical protein G5V58_11785 [Nocardioides anomalus]